MGPTGLPFSDPRYGCLSSVPPVMPPPPISLLGLYTSPRPPLVLPEPLFRRPVIGLSDELEQSSPELKDIVNAEEGRSSSMSPQIAGDSAQPASYPSLLLRTQNEALHRNDDEHVELRPVCLEDAAADIIECRRSRCCCTAPTNRQRRLTRTELSTPNQRASPQQRLNAADAAALTTRKAGRRNYTLHFNIAFYRSICDLRVDGY